MSSSTTAIAPTHLADALAVTRAHLETAEWRAVRRGLGLTSWGLVGVPAGLLGLFLVHDYLGRTDPPGFLLLFVSLVGLLCGGMGLVSGVALTLMVPRRARLGRRVGTCFVGLLVGVVLLVTALTWRDVPQAMLSAPWPAGRRVLTLSGLAALLVAHLGYCLCLAGVAGRFGSRRLARGFVVLFGCLLFQVVLIAAAESVAVYGGPRWLPFGTDWKDALILCAGGMQVGLGLAWSVALWLLRRRLPRGEGLAACPPGATAPGGLESAATPGGPAHVRQ